MRSSKQLGLAARAIYLAVEVAGRDAVFQVAFSSNSYMQG